VTGDFILYYAENDFKRVEKKVAYHITTSRF
jgi:hypothetical protein